MSLFQFLIWAVIVVSALALAWAVWQMLIGVFGKSTAAPDVTIPAPESCAPKAPSIQYPVGHCANCSKQSPSIAYPMLICKLDNERVYPQESCGRYQQ